MLRIFRMRSYRDLQPADFVRALERGQHAAAAVEKVKGVSWCRAYFSGSDMVFVAEGEDYGAADRVLADADAAGASGSLLEFGFRPVSDEFLMDLQQSGSLAKKAAERMGRELDAGTESGQGGGGSSKEGRRRR